MSFQNDNIIKILTQFVQNTRLLSDIMKTPNEFYFIMLFSEVQTEQYFEYAKF